MTSTKRVLILAQDGDSTRIVYNALRQRFDVCAVVLENAVSRRQFLQRRVRKLGLATVVSQLAFRGFVVPALAARASRRLTEIRREHSLDISPIDPARITRVASVNTPACIDVLKRLAPDVVVVNGTRIISKSTLESIAAPFINIHTGITPLYRGVHGGYWALAEGRPNFFGTTIHLVDTGIDTGNVLAQALIEPGQRDNFVTYPCLQYAAAMPALQRVIAEVLAGQMQTIPAASSESRLWSHPTVGQYLTNLVRHRVW